MLQHSAKHCNTLQHIQPVSCRPSCIYILADALDSAAEGVDGDGGGGRRVLVNEGDIVGEGGGSIDDRPIVCLCNAHNLLKHWATILWYNDITHFDQCDMTTWWSKHQRRMDICNTTYWRVSHDAIKAHTLFFFEIVQQCEYAVIYMACLIHTCE